ncbi:sortase [Candidatus Saccharibacteria bacterium]|nr:sortase [Candidatus Saccharibacteria bacterium]
MGDDQDKNSTNSAQQKAAIDLARQKVLQTFKTEPENYTDVETPAAKAVPDNVTTPNNDQAVPAAQPVPANYNQNQASSPAVPNISAKEWKKYHSAWQDYYRKYYEEYYVDAVQKTASTLAKQQTSANSEKVAIPTAEEEETDKKETFDKLRDRISHRTSDSARKFRKSRHFIPIVSGLVVMLIFIFLQYNRLFFAVAKAYVVPGGTDTTITELDPTVTAAVGPDPKLIIPKINVQVPIIFGIGNDYSSQMAGMAKGVTQFAIPGANALPGQVGNLAISGHSSNDVFDPGDYKFIFARLSQLTNGDIIYVNYKSVRYTYAVVRQTTVDPTNVQALVFPTDKPMLTLITCMPVGTARYRLLVTAEQIDPEPGSAKPSGDDSQKVKPASLPSNSPTLLQRFVDWITKLFSH